MNIKKYVGFLLSLIMLFSFGITALADFKTTVSTGVTEDTFIAVYTNAEYEITLRNAVYLDGYEDDGKMLTDTRLSRPFAYGDKENEGWIKVKSYNGQSDYRITVVTDLGYYARGLTTFYSRNYRNVSKGIDFPASVKFYISRYGDDYEYIGDGTTLTGLDTQNDTAIFKLVTEKGVSGRFIKTVFECRGDQIFYINELCAAADAKLFRANYSKKDLIKDQNGVEYIIDRGEAKIVGFDTAKRNNVTAIEASDACFDQDGLVYYLGNGSDNPVKVISDFIDTDQKNYSGAPNNIEYIVIHNTATTSSDTDAERYNHRLHTSDDTSSWHYTVDENVIYHSLADSVTGWHAGPSHNYHSIGIEMCVNGAPGQRFSGERYDQWVDEHFRYTMKNTAVLVAELLTRYGLSTDAVIQHYDVSEKNCPQWLRHKDGSFVYEGDLWLEFMRYVEKYYHDLNGSAPTPETKPDGKVVIPDYIILRGGEVYPVTEIANRAFADQEDFITSIELGIMIDTVGEDCFDGSEGIEAITVRSGNTRFYNKNGILYDRYDNVVYDPSAIEIVVPTPDEACRLDIRKIDKRYYIFTKDENYKLSQIEKEYGKAITKAIDANGSSIDKSDVVGTGAVITFEDGAKLYLVVRGDVDGDAKITATDYIMTKRIYFGTFYPTKRQTLAAAFSNGKSVTMMDYILLKRHYFGTFDLMR